MKTDRLVGIVFYLLQRNATARQLAEHFEVSTRTIFRDIASLCNAGIPVAFRPGSGYFLTDSFTPSSILAGPDDCRNILAALEGIQTASGDQSVEATLYRIACATHETLSRQKEEQRVFYDFSACRESAEVSGGISECFRMLKTTLGHSAVCFDYTAADGALTHREVEPLALTYRWYQWYMLGWCRMRKDYRLFKLSRIHSPVLSENHSFTRTHPPAAELIKQHFAQQQREMITVTLRCQPDVFPALSEYLHAVETASKQLPANLLPANQKQKSGWILCSFTVPEGERLWYSLLMGFSDTVEVLSPKELRESLRKSGEKLTRLYAK